MGLISRVSNRTYRYKTMASDEEKPKIEPGLIYISSIPEGMTPASLRQIMTKQGEIGRIYLAPWHSKNTKKQNSYNSGRFKEGWIEFENKRRAKKVANKLNLQPVNDKKHGAWCDQFWSLKYLSKFRWDDLHEQLEYERQHRKKTIREEFNIGRAEQNEFLKVVGSNRKKQNIERNRKIQLLNLDENKLPKQRKIASE